jgi:phosphoglycerol transferase MdoB-like AlkP superfamily enzyme
VSARSAWARWAGLAAALCLLNVVLTLHNVWPTPAVRLAQPVPEWSIELLLVLLGVLAWGARRGALPAWLPALLAVAWLLLGVARYLEITAPALYGRPVNLYWDLRHVGNVANMLAQAAGTALALGVLLAVVAATGLAFLALRLAWRRVAAAATHAAERRVLAGLAGVLAVAWLAGVAGHPPAPGWLRFSVPVTATITDQLRLTSRAFADARQAPPGDDAAANAAPSFAALAGDDVLLVFLESYGSITLAEPALAARLANERQALAQAVAASGRRALSATVVAPTFGGNSWLSHLSLLSGRDVTDPGAYARTMQGRGSTLVGDFNRAGYETLALMPGLRQAWPEGAFYRFDRILGADALDYRGPEFGWWRIPDQFVLARLDDEPRADRPRFVFFTTISSHAPFRPTPPYQPDWTRLLGPTPYGAEAEAAIAQQPDWTNLSPAYGDSIAYALQWLAGYLALHAEAALTVVILGDHQPPAAVSGPGREWTVPVHVITRRDGVLDALRGAGFVDGLEPPLAPIDTTGGLRARLSRAFSGSGAVDAPRVDVARGADAAVVGQQAP